MSNKYSICIIDDHEIVRHGLRNVFSRDYGFEVTGEAGSCQEAGSLIEMIRPDVFLIDQMLGDGSGFALADKVRIKCSECKILILTAFPVSDELQERYLGTIVDGILYKDQNSSQIRKAVWEALGDNHFEKISPQSLIKSLSVRERDILRLIAQGLQNKEISSELGISEKTVRNRISNIFKKIKVGNRTEASRLFLQQ